MVYGSRFREDPGYKVPIGRRIGNLIFSVVLTAITRQRITDPTSGFRMTNRRGIELFARDYPHDYPEVEAILMLHAHRLRDPRGAGADERARLRAQLDRLPAQRLLHGEGPARALRRALPPPAPPAEDDPPTRPRASRSPPGRRRRAPTDAAGGRDERRAAAPSPPRAASTPASRSSRSSSPRLIFRAVLELVRRPRLVERYALLWMIVAGRAARARDLDATCSPGAPTCSASRCPRTRSSSPPSRSPSCCCCTSRSRPRGSPRRPRSSPRRSRASTASSEPRATATVRRPTASARPSPRRPRATRQ